MVFAPAAPLSLKRCSGTRRLRSTGADDVTATMSRRPRRRSTPSPTSVDWRNELLENSRGVADNLLCGECMGSYVATVLTPATTAPAPSGFCVEPAAALHTANATLAAAKWPRRERCWAPAPASAAASALTIEGNSACAPPRRQRRDGRARVDAPLLRLGRPLAAPFRDPAATRGGGKGARARRAALGGGGTSVYLVCEPPRPATAASAAAGGRGGGVSYSR